MHEIDLIPREHVERRRVRRVVLRAAVAGAAVLVVTAGCRLAINLSIAQQRPAVEQWRQSEQLAVAQRARVAELAQHKATVDARLASLRSLQQRADWQAALHSVDRAFSKGIWLDQLVFTRAAATPSAPKEQLLEIKGHAVDHAAVTAFTRALREQPAVRSVRLVDTGLRRYSTTQVVDFTVAATTLDPAGSPP